MNLKIRLILLWAGLFPSLCNSGKQAMEQLSRVGKEDVRFGTQLFLAACGTGQRRLQGS